MSDFSVDKAVVQEIHFSEWKDSGVQVFVKREDLIDPKVSGNKWRKLIYNIEQFKLSKKDAVLSFGGAFSNHLHSLARVGEVHGIKTIGIVRGEEPKLLSSTLQDCLDMGMELHFVSREEYRMKDEKSYKEELHEKFGSIYIVPEGGNNYYGLIGCQEILQDVTKDFNAVMLGLGTGNTFSGIISSGYNADFYGISALKGDFHEQDVKNFLEMHLPDSDVYVDWEKVHFIQDKHQGGFAKINQDMIDFARVVYKETDIELDLIYNTKVWMALNDMIKEGKFNPGSKILLVHTGGLQGNRGWETKSGEKLY